MSTRVIISLPEKLLRKIDEWRRHEPDIPPRAEAIRRLVERGLEHETLFNLAGELWEAMRILREGKSLTPEHENCISTAMLEFGCMVRDCRFPEWEMDADTPDNRADLDRAGFIFHEGKQAGAEGKPLSANPYRSTVGRHLWEAGHKEAS